MDYSALAKKAFGGGESPAAEGSGPSKLASPKAVAGKRLKAALNGDDGEAIADAMMAVMDASAPMPEEEGAMPMEEMVE